jgi:urea carboxylase
MAELLTMSTFQPGPETILPGGFTHIHKVLIANRGEIACRIIKTCKSLGLSSVSIYSPADRSSLHVRQADEAYLLPGSDQTAYIDEEAILKIAIQSGAQAVIPGYGELLLA